MPKIPKANPATKAGKKTHVPGKGRLGGVGSGGGEKASLEKGSKGTGGSGC